MTQVHKLTLPVTATLAASLAPVRMIDTAANGTIPRRRRPGSAHTRDGLPPASTTTLGQLRYLGPTARLPHGLRQLDERQGLLLSIATTKGTEVGEAQGDDPLGLPGGKAEQSEEVLGDLIGGLGIVAFRVIMEELAEAE